MAQKKNRSEGEQTPDDVTVGVFLLGLSVDDATAAITVCEGNDTRSLSLAYYVSFCDDEVTRHIPGKFATLPLLAARTTRSQASHCHVFF